MHWQLKLVLGVLLAVVCWPATSDGFPRPEDASLVVTSTAAAPTPIPTTTAVGSSSTPSAPLVPSSLATPTLESEQNAQQKQPSVPPPQVRSLRVFSNVQYRYAHTLVSSRVANPANQSQEVTFSVVLPETAFISSFAMEVDGKVYKAYVKEKKEAKQTYDAAVQAGQSAGLVAVSARDSNSFTVSLNVEAQNKVSFNLTYEELLTRKLGLYQHVVTLNPGQVVKDLEVRVHIKENKKISKLRVPEFDSGNKIDADNQDCAETTYETRATKCSAGNTLADLTWKSPSEVEVVFRPTEDEQKDIMEKLEAKRKKKKEEEEASHGGQVGRFNAMSWSDTFHPAEGGDHGDKRDSGLNGQFSVEYDVDRDSNGGEVVVNDGYFVHFFSPSELKPLKKHAIFVLDVSGSMDGRKIEQLREAMTAILSDLKEGDYFNLIAFSSDVKVWNLDRPEKSATYYPSESNYYLSHSTTTKGPPPERPPAYPATKENIAKAKEIVKQMSAYGGTNINDALKTALDCARDGVPSAADASGDRPEPIILFLTDGDPTVGLSVPSLITSGISELNRRPRSSIFSLAFGEGADIKFLRKLSLSNGGFARTIYEAADASMQLKNFYRQISSPLLANVSFQYIPEKVERDSMTQLEFRTFFDGTELVVAGRTANKGVQELGGQVMAVGDGGKNTSYTPHLVPVDQPLTIYPFDVEGPLFNGTQAPREASVLERLWAYLTIKQLLDKQDALDATSPKEERVPEPIPTPTYSPPLALPARPDGATTPSRAVTPSEKLANSDISFDVPESEPKHKALKLALKYSFVTPLTSLVVVKPNETKTTDAHTVNPAEDGAQPLGLFGGLALGVTSNRIGGSSFIAGPPGLAAAFAAPAPERAPHPAPSTPLAPHEPLMAATGVDSLQTDEHEPVSHALIVSTTAAYNRAPPLGTKFSALAIAEEDAVAALPEALHLDRVDSVNDLMANISDVKWLPRDALPKSIDLPLGVNGTKRSYQIATNETDPEPLQACKITFPGPQQTPASGVCRHFANCVIAEVTERIEDFAPYQCTIGDYLAICCPTDEVSSAPVPTPTTPDIVPTPTTPTI